MLSQRLYGQSELVLILVMPLINCVTFVKLLNQTSPQFPHLDNRNRHSTQVSNGVKHLEGLVWNLTSSTYSVAIIFIINWFIIHTINS